MELPCGCFAFTIIANKQQLIHRNGINRWIYFMLSESIRPHVICANHVSKKLIVGELADIFGYAKLRHRDSLFINYLVISGI